MLEGCVVSCNTLSFQGLPEKLSYRYLVSAERWKNFLQKSRYCRARSNSRWSRFYSLDVHLALPDIQTIRRSGYLLCSERYCSLWVMHQRTETRFIIRLSSYEVSQISRYNRNLHRPSFRCSVRLRSFRAQVWYCSIWVRIRLSEGPRNLKTKNLWISWIKLKQLY